MKKLNLVNINKKAPYVVHERENKLNEFYFWSDFGIVYDIYFSPNYSVVPSGTCEIGINNRGHQNSPRDPNFLLTLIAIIEEFFNSNDDVMLYMAETGDKKESFRNRLFVMWFNSYEKRKDYFLKTAEGKMEGQDNFMAIIARIDNPRLPQVIEEFDETISILFDPPKDNLT